MRTLPPVHSIALLLLVAPAAAASGGGEHADPLARSLLALASILVAANLGGALAARLGQPSVLGELFAGIVLGNLGLFGVGALSGMADDPAVGLLAQLGVLILLFDVGLESTVDEMLRVGPAAMLVALLGVLGPLALGWLVGAWLLPDEAPPVHAFLGATLCATSVGITARVLQDLGKQSTSEARVILGAAVVDDVLGLVILAVVAGTLGGAAFTLGGVLGLIAKAALFLVGALVLGRWVSPRLLGAAARLNTPGALLASGLSLCFALSWAAAGVGLAAIVGAFAAGLVIEEQHACRFTERGEPALRDSLRPLGQFLAPVFFVQMGLRTDLRVFASADALLLALALTVAAVLGKQLCSAGVVGVRASRLAVGLGMIPRGEVGLIFADVGRSLTSNGHPVLGPATYSAVVMMVLATTVMTPPALKWALGRAPPPRA